MKKIIRNDFNRIIKVFAAIIFLCVLMAASIQTDSCSSSVSSKNISDDEYKKEIKKSVTLMNSREEEAVRKARHMVGLKGGGVRIIATSPSVADICSRLDLELVGICNSTVSRMPKRYKGTKVIGTPMAPDMEKVASAMPDWILSPRSLQADLQPKYEAIRTQWAFLNLDSVQGLYKSIYELGIIFGKEKQAEELIEKYADSYMSAIKKVKGKKKPRILILMGLPGSYVVATDKSYVGNLVEMAGGDNVYKDTEKSFLTVNTEDIKKKNPDVIVRTAHALPDEVVKMFEKEFKTNGIWKHFDAVKKGRVYDLSYENFGMSANFKYKDALKEVQPMIFAKSRREIKRAKKVSMSAKKKAEESHGKDKYEKKKRGEN
ncbi:MAG: heme ABC transporter substrate-binding protein IsdE [Hornefia sp.]|nr:heme ABC transporter substrate-binding protein IsdE [Hornefia sp.]